MPFVIWFLAKNSCAACDAELTTSDRFSICSFIEYSRAIGCNSQASLTVRSMGSYQCRRIHVPAA